MNGLTKFVIVIYGAAGVQNTESADRGRWIDDGSRHDDRSGADAHIATDNRGGVNQRRKLEATTGNRGTDGAAHGVRANRHGNTIFYRIKA